MVQPYNSSHIVMAWKNSCFIRDIRFPYNWWLVSSSPCFTYAYLDITFRRWDIATKVNELVYLQLTLNINRVQDSSEKGSTANIYQVIGLMSIVFTNGPVNRVLVPGRVIPKTQKMVLDAVLLSTQHCKVRIKSKVEQSRERSSALPYTLV